MTHVNRQVVRPYSDKIKDSYIFSYKKWKIGFKYNQNQKTFILDMVNLYSEFRIILTSHTSFWYQISGDQWYIRTFMTCILVMLVIVRKTSLIIEPKRIKSIYMIHGAIKRHQEENNEGYSMHTAIKVTLIYVRITSILIKFFFIDYRPNRLYAYLPKIPKYSTLECFIAFYEKAATKLIII